MSAEETLTERDKAVLGETVQESDQDQDDHLDAQRAALTARDTPSNGEVETRVEQLEDLLEDQQETIRNLTRMVNELQAAVDGDDARLDGLTRLEKYAKMEPDQRDELDIGVSKERAVLLFENWWEVSVKAQNGNYCLSTHRSSTKKNNPSQVKIDLERLTGLDLAWEQVYRAMKELAKLSAVKPESAVEVVTDDYGRMHITGGAFEYHERPTPDGQTMNKKVELTDADSLTLL